MILQVLYIEMNNRVYVFIDASNLWEAQKKKGKLFDFAKLKSYLQTQFNASVLEIFYYTAFPKEHTRDHSVQRKHNFFVFLKKSLKFNVVKKPLKQIILQNGTIQEKGNMDVELTIDVVQHISNYDTAVFFTGDSDFLALVHYVQNKNKQVYVYSSNNSISHELKSNADYYVDVLGVKEDIWRNIVFKSINQ